MIKGIFYSFTATLSAIISCGNTYNGTLCGRWVADGEVCLEISKQNCSLVCVCDEEGFFFNSPVSLFILKEVELITV